MYYSWPVHTSLQHNNSISEWSTQQTALYAVPYQIWGGRLHPEALQDPVQSKTIIVCLIYTFLQAFQSYKTHS